MRTCLSPNRAGFVPIDRHRLQPAYARRIRSLALILALTGAALALAGCTAANESTGGTSARVERVVDGDTIRLTDGRRIRLVQIDAPEVSDGECYADEATAALRRLTPPGTQVQLESDPALDDHDRFGRLLRYVIADGDNVNLQLVEDGAASVWFFDGDRGRYAGRFLAAATAARAENRGLWRACPGTRLDPSHGVETG